MLNSTFEDRRNCKDRKDRLIENYELRIVNCYYLQQERSAL